MKQMSIKDKLAGAVREFLACDGGLTVCVLKTTDGKSHYGVSRGELRAGLKAREVAVDYYWAKAKRFGMAVAL